MKISRDNIIKMIKMISGANNETLGRGEVYMDIHLQLSKITHDDGTLAIILNDVKICNLCTRRK